MGSGRPSIGAFLRRAPNERNVTMTLKKIAALALAAMMLCSVLSACGNPDASSVPGTSSSTQIPTTSSSAQPQKVMYQVSVFDVYGQPATSGVIVKFMQNGEQIALQKMNASGVAEKELDAGEYDVELMFTGGDVAYYYDTTDLKLTATKTQLMINLCLEQGTEFETVYHNDVAYDAYMVNTGNTRVTLKPGRNYFLYTPEMSGEYEMFASDSTYKVGYYGAQHFINEIDIGHEAPNNGTAVSISDGMVSPNSQFVIGIDNPNDEDVVTVLHVVRTGAYIDTSIPKENYRPTHTLTAWTKPADKTVKKFDIGTAVPYKLVLDEATGFYHLNDVNGPLVVVFLGEGAKDHITCMVPYDTVIKNTNVSAGIKDENGNTIKLEVFTSCLQQYIGVYDENMKDANGKIVGGYEGGCIDRASGLYPLTEDLMYIIKQHGTYSGWWDSSSGNYLFEDVMVSAENAWLFMCGYLE